MTAFAPVDTRKDIGREGIAAAVAGLETPLVFKGAVAGWPLVRQPSVDALIDCLKAADAGKPVETLRQTGGDGRFFYGEDGQGFNFQRASVPLAMTLERLRKLAGDCGGDERLYIQSAPLDLYFPQLAAENRLPGIKAAPRAWIGNRAVTATHFDLYDNLVCMVAGRKRFILFPPEQTKNLYMGPLDHTISGVPTSMADIDAPDFTRFPRLKEALAAGLVAELAPGDVLFVPYMWWHQVMSDEAFNMQVNYWWNPADDLPQPMQALIHALLAVRDLPPGQNRAWKAMFDHFIFHQSDPVADHLPQALRGLLGDMPTDQRIDILKGLGKGLAD
ncbi:cupin-like domain-containing protein [Asticcacaulis sp. EMRT-3]|uniref:cupin-like domain-containing protein n=1 Tax=Asticcacaulis sp. EMRT-3 TaxID=3040349 RepID=UPI0024AF00E2|nr:cupin-like domain-containing protein [Asticcacaulis sp. EMRT-3]MDI7775202.1 cupin-like domain-containing protein [Asticcacaulis sp. EMRT-3]